MQTQIILTTTTKDNLVAEITSQVLSGFVRLLDEREKDSANLKQNYTIKEATILLRVSKTTIFDYLNKGILVRKKIGNRTLIPKESIDKAIRTVEPI